MAKPNILFIMTDQQRFDTIAALGNSHIYTPNMNRLVERGATFTNAYSTTPVCMAARCTIRTGCDAPKTRVFTNHMIPPAEGQADTVEGRCGPYLAKVMASRGYRTFGIGKFHSSPWNEDLGYQVHLHSEEMYGTPERRSQDAYASFLAREHPAYDHLEGLMGERTEMYYMPQQSLQPAALTVESWAADRAIAQIQAEHEDPFFGLVSFIGPHPPLAPPIPFNRMYDPDRMPNPIKGYPQVDHMDEQIPGMNYMIWAEDINDPHARVLKARYYGEISYIDHCLGRILDAVEARPDADNTLICFFADHGDHLGDHHAWQKESFFEASCRVPFLLSWPKKIAPGSQNDSLVCLTDLFGIATAASGEVETRDGIDVLGVLDGKSAEREILPGYYQDPGKQNFKIMIRQGDWKYIYFANGRREQLFNLKDDPNELQNRASSDPEMKGKLRAEAVKVLQTPGGKAALEDGGEELKGFDFEPLKRRRIYQFDGSKGVKGFPDSPGDVLKDFVMAKP